MSRIGKKIIEIPSSVEINITDGLVNVKGPLGEESFQIPSYQIKVSKVDNILKVERTSEEKKIKSLHGLSRMLIANIIEGLTKGFEKKLEIKGVGYRCQLEGNKLILFLGYSHPIEFPAPEGIKFKVEKNVISVTGNNKQQVGQVSAKIRSFRKPDAYKGKGVRYFGELIKLKPGKTAKAGVK